MPDLRSAVLTPARLGALLGVVLGGAFASPLPMLLPWGYAPSHSPLVYAALGAMAAGLVGRFLGSFALRRPIAAFLWDAVLTYVVGILLTPLVLAIVPGAATRELLGQRPAMASVPAMYAMTPFALLIYVPVFVLIIPCAVAWVVLQRRLAVRSLPAEGGIGIDAMQGPTAPEAATDRDRTVNRIGLVVTLVVAALAGLALLFLANLKIGY
jgi:hypothetical protein